ncbi:MAG TPA: 2Fe-2S iron-sulfur cluster-binding protein [Bacteroidota bacterium]|nr:2Fe-2S iron-sulfur cluster-binding protein [Bacteroidota bacterium]
MPVLTLQKEGKTIEVPLGANLRKTLLKHGISPYRGIEKIVNCMGNGLCGTCRVEVADGKGVSPMTPMEEAALVGFIPFYARSIPKNVRLSCRAAVTGDLAVGTHPAVGIDGPLTKQRLALLAIWSFFGGIFFFVVVRLLIEIATGR